MKHNFKLYSAKIRWQVTLGTVAVAFWLFTVAMFVSMKWVFCFQLLIGLIQTFFQNSTEIKVDKWWKVAKNHNTSKKVVLLHGGFAVELKGGIFFSGSDLLNSETT